MMKYYRKSLNMFLAFVFFLSVFSINSNAITNVNAFTEKDNSAALEETEYAIFTEDYLFEYTIDHNGNIITTPESLEALKLLSNDKEAVKKILFDKNITNLTYSNKNNDLEVDSSECIKAFLDIDNLTYTKENKIVISDKKIANSVRALSNFQKSIKKVSQSSYGDNGVKLVVKYEWEWDYTPVVTLTDIVSIVWSDEFDSDGGNVKFKYEQSGYRRITNSDGSFSYDYNDTASNVNLNLSGDDAYSDGTPSVGFQKSYDIKRVFYKGSKTYHVSKHSGSFQVTVTRSRIPSNDDGEITFRGDYFHQTIKPDITLTLTKDGPESTIGLTTCYDKASSCVKTISY